MIELALASKGLLGVLILVLTLNTNAFLFLSTRGEDDTGAEIISPDVPEEPVPGKIKITFHRKDEEVRLHYERDMKGGELSSDDRFYVERILSIIDDYRYNATDESSPFLRFMKRINKFRR